MLRLEEVRLIELNASMTKHSTTLPGSDRKTGSSADKHIHLELRCRYD